MPLRGFLSVGHSRKDRLRAPVPLVIVQDSPNAGRVGSISGPFQVHGGPGPTPLGPERGGVGLRDALVHAPRESTAQALVFLKTRRGTRRIAPQGRSAARRPRAIVTSEEFAVKPRCRPVATRPPPSISCDATDPRPPGRRAGEASRVGSRSHSDGSSGEVRTRTPEEVMFGVSLS